MKQLFLSFVAVCLFWLAAQAQPTEQKINMLKNAYLRQSHSADPAQTVPGVKPVSKDSHKTRGDNPIELVEIGSSMNWYSIIANNTHQLYYDEALNALVFVHRQWRTTGETGVVAYDVSTDGGASWSIGDQDEDDLVFSSTANEPTRYPNITIWNPTGSTNADDARIVSVGPALTAPYVVGGNNSFGHLFRGSCMLDNSNPKYTRNSLTGSSNEASLCYSLINHPDGSLWAANVNLDNSQLLFYKGSYDTPSGSFIWDLNNLETPPLYEYQYDGDMVTLFIDPNVVFGPSGDVGYAFGVGIEADKGGGPVLAKMLKPIIYKTTDGGDNWARIGAYFDFTKLPVLMEAMSGLYDWVGMDNYDVIPQMSIVDATVDKNDRLHLFATYYKGAEESEGIGVYYVFQGGMFDMVTSDGENWENSRYIGDWGNSIGTYGTGSDTISLEACNQIVRDDTGDKIFFLWTESVPDGDDYDNKAPALWGSVMDVDAMQPSKPRNMTLLSAADNEVLFPKAAPLAMTTGDYYDYELPVVYARLEPKANLLAPPQYIYIRNMGFDISEIPYPVDILSAELTGQTRAQVDTAKHKVTILMPGGSSLTALSPEFDLSMGADITPTSGSEQDFSSPVNYTVSQESQEQVWEVSVIAAAPDDILNLIMPEAKQILFDYTNHTVQIVLKPGTSQSALSPTIIIPDGASVDPMSGVPQDFSSSVVYTVSNGDDSQAWTISTEVAVGVDELENATKTERLVYPNPTTGALTLTNTQGAEIMVFNLLGELLYQAQGQDSHTRLDLSAYEKGTYIIKVVSGQAISTHKVIYH